MKSLTEIIKQGRVLVWQTPLEPLSVWARAGIETARIAWVVIRDLVTGQPNLRAMSLVYTTLMSLVPSLAITFAILRSFGYHERMRTVMAEFLAPLGERGVEVTRVTMEFVENVNVSVLGSAGLALLIYTLVSMMQKVERAFNEIWQVEAGRSIGRRFADFLSVGLLGPLLLFTGIGVLASALSSALVTDLAQVSVISHILSAVNRATPYIVLILVFSAFYFLIPHTRVRLGSAVIGGLVAGVIWGATGWTFATFIVTSARYAAIYSAFASLILFMVWLYTAWLILLVGCSVAFYHQNRHHLSPTVGIVRLTAPQLDRMTVLVLLLIHRAFHRGQTPWTADTLSERLHVPAGALDQILTPLRRGGYLAVSTFGSRLVPTRPPELTRIIDALAMVRKRRERGHIADEELGQDPVADGFFDRLDAARRSVFDDVTLADLLKEDEVGETAKPVARP